MSKRNHAEDTQDAMFAAGIIVVGVALAIEVRYFVPHDPIAALFKVLGAALLAIAIVRSLSRR